MTSGLTDAGRALIEHACNRLVLESVAANDRQDFDAFAALFTPDGVLRRPAGDPLIGREAIVESYRDRPVDRITRHLCANVLIDVDSPESARGVTLVLLYSASATAKADRHYGVPANSRRLLGEFEDVFRLTPEGWRIAERSARFVMHA